MNEETIKNINILGSFCGKRDLPTLSKAALLAKYDIPQADIMVLFGGTIIAGGDVLAEAMKSKIAKNYIIVGGKGHTTEALRKTMNDLYPTVFTENLSEAEIFTNYLKEVYQLTPDFLECESTNCGNNITYLLQLIKEQTLPFDSIIFSQDATMQLRMDACLKKYTHSSLKLINFATYQAEIFLKNSGPSYMNPIKGMWTIEHYLSLLLGEIPRLTDNSFGYGPNGKNFIAHVDIPVEVQHAFHSLSHEFPHLIRTANPAFASTNEES